MVKSYLFFPTIYNKKSDLQELWPCRGELRSTQDETQAFSLGWYLLCYQSLNNKLFKYQFLLKHAFWTFCGMALIGEKTTKVI